mgnify:CR=1 FL=1|jgi:hypothetical protein
MSLERNGIPTATYITTAFEKYARGLCRMQSMEALPLIIIQHPVAARPTEELIEKVRKTYPEVHAALSRG